MGQGTKSLRDSPLRGGQSREPVASRENSESGWRGHRDQQAYCSGATCNTVKRIKMTCRSVLMRRETSAHCWNEKIGLDELRHSVCLKPAGLNSARKKLIHAHATERSSTDQSRNDCKMCDFCHILPGATI
jgi:hypothetical protein